MSEEIVQEQASKPVEAKADEVVTMRQLLECGVHFGHQTKRWNPKMKKYIFTSRNGIHVIDLQQSIKLIKKTYEFVKEISKQGGTVLFVGTKKQAQEAISFEAERCEMPYVNHRWLGGTLTNHVTVRQSINKMNKYTQMKEDGTFDKLSNKEASRKTKTLTRLEYYLKGIKSLVGVPAAIFVVDTKREQLSIDEANKLKIPIIGVVDTNADPNEVQWPIPANDDAIRAIKLLCSIMANAVIEGRKEQVKVAAKKAASKAERVEKTEQVTTEEVKKEVKAKKTTETKEKVAKSATAEKLVEQAK